MDGVHDLGGMHGFGPVIAEHDEPVFHADWERRAFAILIAAMTQGACTTDANRHAIERMGNAEYLATSYYEHWIAAMETVLVENETFGRDELSRRAEVLMHTPDAFPTPHAEPNDELAATLLAITDEGGPTERIADRDPRFDVGEDVRTVNRHVATHTRLPRYARGRIGTVVAYRGFHVFPDTNAHEGGEQPQPLYTVRFDARELWGAEYESPDDVRLDLFEPYLAPVASSTVLA